jgi:hypothetical protein
MLFNREYRAARMNTLDGAFHVLRVRIKIFNRVVERDVMPKFRARLAQIREHLQTMTLHD